jgi:predicted HicB family RNase H-like nuclease
MAERARGRPPKPADRALSDKVLFRLSPLEKKTFEEAASVAGQELAPWIRDRLRHVAQRELDKAGRSVPFRDVVGERTGG